VVFFFSNFKKRKKKLTSDRYPTSKSVLFEFKKKYPNKIPTIPKSESSNVVPSNPSEPRTGSKSAGKNEMRIPLANAQKMGASSAACGVAEYSCCSGEKVRN
jgi:hypothetical protein